MSRLLTLLLLSASWAAGQTMTADSVVRKDGRYFFSARTGMTICSECSIDGPTTGYINIVQGIRLTPGTRLGVGFGLMSASERLIVPFFGNFKVDLLGKKNKLFIEANYGVGATRTPAKEEQYWTETIKTKSYFQPSIGYSIKYHDLKIGVLIGMQWLQMVSTFSYPSYGWIADYRRTGSDNTTEFKYDVARMMVGISVGWRD